MEVNNEKMVAAMASIYTDWYLDILTPKNAVVYPGPERIKPQLYSFAQQLALEVETSQHTDYTQSFIVECAGIRYRAQNKGNSKFALRVLKRNVWPLEKLQFRQAHLDLLMNIELRKKGGLVLIAGSTGSGKSTTAGTVIAARLRKFGGHCETVEDPPEEPLSGWHGSHGFCQQSSVIDGNWKEAMAVALRSFPAKTSSILLVGEVRIKDAAAELLRIAVDGHLVFSTIHANGITEAIQRLLNLARKDVGEYEARLLLANSLRLCIHQRLDNNIPQVTMLPVNSQVASIIKNGATLSLQDEIEVTRRRISSLPTNFLHN